MEIARSLHAWFNREGLEKLGHDLRAGAKGCVVRSGPRVVGFATWALLADEAAELTWMGVEESRQRSGAGTALLAAVIQEIRSLGVKTLQVSTVAESVYNLANERTRRFYHSRGFRELRIDVDYYGEEDDWYDRVVLALDVPGWKFP